MYYERYAKMRNGVVAHECYVDADNVDLLRDLDFVFVAVDDNETRGCLLSALDRMQIPFIDVGMGIEKTDEKLLGIVRTSFCEKRNSSAPQRGERGLPDIGEYERNVQIVELNALNAALAVIRWKKHREFYVDLGNEDRSNYTIDGNHMSNTRLKHRDD